MVSTAAELPPVTARTGPTNAAVTAATARPPTMPSSHRLSGTRSTAISRTISSSAANANG